MAAARNLLAGSTAAKRWTMAAAVTAAIAAAFLALAGSAHAAIPLQLDKVAPKTVLYGETSQVELRAHNPKEESEYGYNLTFRDVLPEGISYVPGSSTVAPREISGAPGEGETTLIFENASDLSPGSTYTLKYAVSHETTAYDIGDEYTNDATALISDDPHFIPDFDEQGVPTGGDTAAQAADSATTEISAIEIRKDEKSPEGEIMRGVHDHRTIYALELINNDVQATDELVVEDLLPGGLEFLACGVGDNTEDAPTNPETEAATKSHEYPGTGPLNAGGAPSGLTDCEMPNIVETVEADPDGDGTVDVYTRVVWDELGTIGKGLKRTLRYVAAIPIRENTMTWPEGAPAPASGGQASNLDNNSGTETFDEQELVNYAKVTGQYAGSEEVSGEHSLKRWAEDIAVEKTVSPTMIEQGALSTWTMRIRTSEYRYVENIRVEDKVPNGLCPLGDENFENPASQFPECEGNEQPEEMPSSEYTGKPLENEDGSFTVLWEEASVPELEKMLPSEEFTISYPTRTRNSYQEAFEHTTPVLAEDSWRNHVELSGADYRICVPGDPECANLGTTSEKLDGEEEDGVDDFDSSEAEQQAEPVTLKKEVGTRMEAPVDCASAGYVEGPEDYGPGDIVCWKLHITFPGELDTGDAEITDFMPPGAEYVEGSAVPIGSDSDEFELAVVDTEANALTWKPKEEKDVEPGVVFEWVLATRVSQTPATVVGDLKGNLMKLSYENTGGQSFPVRGEAEFSHSQARIELEKGVAEVNESPVTGGPLADGVGVKQGDLVTFNVLLENEGNLDAHDIVVWDELEDGITCAMVTGVSDEGTCEGTRITWTGLSVPAGGDKTLEYDVTVPEGVEPDRVFDDHAGVVSYTGNTNSGEPFEYIPEENIDPSQTEPNATSADDTSSINTAELKVEKSRTTGINEANNGVGQATIGEAVDYTIEVSIPEGTTIYGPPILKDNVAPRHVLLTSPEPDAKLNNGELPPGVSVSHSGDEVRLEFAESYTNDTDGSGADVFEITFSARVADVAANKRVSPHQSLPNTASFEWQLADETDQKREATTTTTIVEPEIEVEKTHDDPDGIVEPGEQIGYTLKASNSGNTRVSTAYDLVLTDAVPAGMSPVMPLPPGATFEEGMLTWTIAELKHGESKEFEYELEIEDPATAGEIFTNAAELTATSLPGEATGERGPESTSHDGYVSEDETTVRLGDASLTKSVTPGSATIGEEVEYTIETSFPAQVDYFDSTVIDVLPDGMVFEEMIETTCKEGAAEVTCSPAVAELGTEAQGEGETRVGWFLGDVVDHTEPLTYKIVYTAYVAEEYNDETDVSSEDTLTNEAVTRYNGSDVFDETPESVPTAGEFTNGSNEGEATVTVVEPELTLEKKVSGDGDNDGLRTTVPGDAYTYSLVVENAGTGPAYDVEVKDSPDSAKLVEVAAKPAPEGTQIIDGDGNDGSLEWRIDGPLGSGESVTLEYTAKLASSNLLENEDEVPNTAAVPLYWGLDEEAPSEHPARPYEGPEDSVALEVRLPELELSKKVGPSGGAETGDAEVGQAFTWWIEVRNASSAATAEAVDVTDVLPANWEYVEGSTEIASAPGADPDVSEGTPPVGDTLAWEDVATLNAEASVVLTFEAEPTREAGVVPGHGEEDPNVNLATATATDTSGAGGSASGPYEAEDEAEAILELPELVVEKTPDDEDIDAGEVAVYTVVVKNEGDVAAHDVEVTDTLGAGQSYEPGEATASPEAGFSEQPPTGGPGAGETTIVWEIEEIAAGASVTITLPVKTDPGLAEGTGLHNEAEAISRELTSPSGDEGGYEAHVQSDVLVEKETVTEPVVAGEDVEFTIVARNDGPSDATGVVIEDTLPGYLELVSAQSPCLNSSGTVTCTVGDLAAGEEVELTLTAKVDPDQTEDIVNTATVHSTSPDPEGDNNESSTEDPVEVDSNVKVEKTGPSEPVLQGSVFEYEIEVENTGASTAVNVELVDELPEGVAFVGGSGGPCTEAGGTVTCTWAKLEPGEGDVVTIEVEAVDVGSPINGATVSTESNETNHEDNESEHTVEILPMADLTVEKVAAETVAAGAELSYHLKVENEGPSKATDVIVVDLLPVGVVYASSEPECGVEGSTVTCEAGELESGEVREFTVTVKVPFGQAGKTLTNIAVVEGNEGDLDLENDTDEAETKVGPAADIAVSKTAGGATAGGTASWTILVENEGPSAAPVEVSDSVPAMTTLRSGTPSQGHCSVDGNDLSCDLGIMQSGASAQITVLADVAPGTVGKELRNHASATSPYPDPNPGNNEAEAANTVQEPPRLGASLTMVKTASTGRPRLGKPFGYLLRVQNVGAGAAHKVRVIDTMNRPVQVRKVKPSQGRCSHRGGTVTCAIGTIAAHQQATIKVVVVPTTGGAMHNTASVSASNAAEVDADDNIAVAGVKTMVPRASWRVRKRVSRKVVRGGEKVRFSILVRTGKRAVARARVCDRLPAGLVFVKVRGARLKGGNACWSFRYLAPRSRKVMRVVTRADRGFRARRLRNVAAAKAANASRRRDGAGVRVKPAFGGAGGGVTG